jgi:hypothetical protein
MFIDPPANMLPKQVVVKDFICSICHELMIANICSVKCGHMFHPDCISRWIDSTPKCPLCKKKTQTEDIRNHPTLTSSLQAIANPPKEIPDLDKTCHVCHCPFEGLKASQTKCQHLFHVACIIEHCKRKDLCPKCRIPFVKDSLKEITLKPKKNPTNSELIIQEHRKICYEYRNFRDNVDSKIATFESDMKNFKYQNRDKKIEMMVALGCDPGNTVVDQSITKADIEDYQNFNADFVKRRIKADLQADNYIPSPLATFDIPHDFTHCHDFPRETELINEKYENLRGTHIFNISPPKTIGTAPILGPIETLKVKEKAVANETAKVMFYEGQASGGKFHGWGRSLWYRPGMQPGTYRPIGNIGESWGKQRKTTEKFQTNNKELENNPLFHTSKTYSCSAEFMKPATP